MLRWPALLSIVLAGLIVIGCGRGQPLYDANNVAFVGSQGALTEDQVHDAILAALEQNNWNVRQDRPAKIVADTTFRQHRAEIQINYSETRYSILYRDSENLNFDGTRIHKNYNALIKDLEMNINQQLANS